MKEIKWKFTVTYVPVETLMEVQVIRMLLPKATVTERHCSTWVPGVRIVLYDPVAVFIVVEHVTTHNSI